MKLTLWMKAALWATAIMNIFGAVAFLSQVTMGREFMNLPAAEHPIYLWLISEFIFLFGIAYAWCAWTNQAPRVFIALATAGKLAFFATMAVFWVRGGLPFKAALGASGDLIFGILFLLWLTQTREATQ